MEPSESTMQPTLLARGLSRRCPRCGEWKTFDRYFDMKPECPRCGLNFHPEEGYYVGAMTLNIIFAEVLTVFGLMIVIVATWPDFPVTPLIVVGVIFNLLFPILFYPISKTLWLATDLAFLHKMDPSDLR